MPPKQAIGGVTQPTAATHKAGSTLWIPDKAESWVKGTVVKWEGDAVHVRSSTTGRTDRFTSAQVCQVNAPAQDGVKDNTSLMYLHEPSLLHNVSVRYGRDEIYTYTANILIAVNPYKQLHIYSEAEMDRYRGKSIGLLPPHVFAVADHAHRSMRSSKRSQSILISGESGAGKTETAKYTLRYLTRIAGSSKADLERKILDANPILEAFGNAKTIRNNNSSRFGKYTELNFNGDFKISGSNIVVYLLERSRIVNQSKNERNYHAFYHLLAGASASERSKWHLGSMKASSFHYTNQSGCDTINGVDDANEYRLVRKAMDVLKFSTAEQEQVYRVVAAVLHLGNVKFDPEKIGHQDGSAVRDATHLKHAAELLGIDETQLESNLVTRTMSTRRGKGTSYTLPMNVEAAENNRDAFAKMIYWRLFLWLVDRINTSIGVGEKDYSIGVLDIFGFETFEHNSFEQFCINYCNERLQFLFNQQVLYADQQIYAREGIPWKPIKFDDNSDCIDVIEAKGSGILSILDEQCSLSKATDATFTAKVHQTHNRHPRVSTARMAKFKKLRDEDAFVIKHFAGPVCYETDGFREKNNDSLTADLTITVQGSTDAFLKALFPITDDDDDPSAGKRAKASVSKKFSQQLTALMENLNKTISHFIRCIKPNSVQRNNVFENALVMNQLRFNGMVATLKVFSLGYPTRAHFADIYAKYASLMPKDIKSLDERTFTEVLLVGLEVDRDEFALGLTRVFFRAGRMAFVDELLGDDFHKRSKDVVRKIRKYLYRKRFRRAIWTVVAFVVLREILMDMRDKKRDEQARKEIGKMPTESTLKAWFNTHLRNAEHRRALTNFGSDLSNGEKYIILLSQLDPNCIDAKAALKEKSPERRAANIMRVARDIGCAPSWFNAEDITRASRLMNFDFAALLYTKHPDVEESGKAKEAMARLEAMERERKAEAKRLEQEARRAAKERERAEKEAQREQERMARELKVRAQEAEAAASAVVEREQELKEKNRQLEATKAEAEKMKNALAEQRDVVNKRLEAVLAEQRANAEKFERRMKEAMESVTQLKSRLDEKEAAVGQTKEELEKTRKENAKMSKKLAEAAETLNSLTKDREKIARDSEAQIAQMEREMHKVLEKAKVPSKEVKKLQRDLTGFRLLLVRPRKTARAQEYALMLGVKRFWTSRLLVLKNNVLFVFSGDDEATTTPNAALDLGMCIVSGVPEEVYGRPYTFVVTMREHAHIFEVGSQENLKEWLRLLRESQHRNTRALSVFQVLSKQEREQQHDVSGSDDDAEAEKKHRSKGKSKARSGKSRSTRR